MSDIYGGVSPRLAKKVINLWRDPKIEASYSGLETFNKYLRKKEKIYLSHHELYSIMRHVDEYVVNKKSLQ